MSEPDAHLLTHRTVWFVVAAASAAMAVAAPELQIIIAFSLVSNTKHAASTPIYTAFTNQSGWHGSGEVYCWTTIKK